MRIEDPLITESLFLTWPFVCLWLHLHRTCMTTPSEHDPSDIFLTVMSQLQLTIKFWKFDDLRILVSLLSICVNAMIPTHTTIEVLLHCIAILYDVSKPIYTNIQWYHPQSHVRHHFSKSIPWFLFFRIRSKYPDIFPAFFMLCELFFTSPVLIYLLVWMMPSGKFKGFEILTWLAYIIRE